MKSYYLLFSFFLFFSCDKGENQRNSCGDSIQNFEIRKEDNLIRVIITSENSAGQFDLSYQPYIENANPANGQNYLITGNTYLPIDNFQNINGDSKWVFFVRELCNGEFQAWHDESITIDFQTSVNCLSPREIGVGPYLGGDVRMSWIPPSMLDNPELYEVQYGPKNFVLGEGFTGITNGIVMDYLVFLEDQKIFEFYARSYCGASEGWGEWSAPVSYYVEDTQNQGCDIPGPLNAYFEIVQGDTIGIELRWTQFPPRYSGSFEITVVSEDSDPNSGEVDVVLADEWPIYDFEYNVTYDFYIRRVCNGDTRSPWSQKKRITIER